MLWEIVRQFESCLLELLNVVVTLFSLSGGIKGWLCRSVGGWGFRHYAPLEPHLMPLQIKKNIIKLFMGIIVIFSDLYR